MLPLTIGHFSAHARSSLAPPPRFDHQHASCAGISNQSRASGSIRAHDLRRSPLPLPPRAGHTHTGGATEAEAGGEGVGVGARQWYVRGACRQRVGAAAEPACASAGTATGRGARRRGRGGVHANRSTAPEARRRGCGVSARRCGCARRSRAITEAAAWARRRGRAAARARLERAARRGPVAPGRRRVRGA